MKPKNTISSHLKSTFIMSTVVPIVTVLLCFSSIYFFSMVQRERENVKTLSSSISQSFIQDYYELDSITNTYYMYNDVFKEVAALNNPKLYQYYNDLDLRDLENNYTVSMTKHIYTSRQNIRNIVFFPINVNLDQGYIVGKRSARLSSITYTNYSESDWFKQALDKKGMSSYYPVHTPEYFPEIEVFSNVRAIIDPDNQRIIGVIKIDVSKDDLISKLTDYNLNTHDRITLVDDKNADIVDMGYTIKNTEKTGIVFQDGKFYFQDVNPVAGTSWTLIYQMSFNTLIYTFIGIMITTLILVFVVVSISQYFYLKKSKQLIDEVDVILSSFSSIEAGEFNPVIEIPTTSELQKITYSLNDMIEELQHYIEREYLLVIQQKHAEFKALQSQINPHFLYNILNGFIGLNRMGEVEVLEKAIINLTRLFRYTTDQQDFVDLSQEIEFLQGYLELELLKHPSSLSYEISVDPSIKEFKIPKLLLQPLIENSITHGYGTTKESIHIRLIVEAHENNGIKISVEDNGVGFDDENINSAEGSIGLKNTMERTIYFDRDAIFKIKSLIGLGTQIEIILHDSETEEQ